MAVALMLGTTAGVPEMFTGIQDSSIMTVDAAVLNTKGYTNRDIKFTDINSKEIVFLSKGTPVTIVDIKTTNKVKYYKIRVTKTIKEKNRLVIKKYEG